MKEVSVEKITLNIGAGRDENKLQRGVELLEKITGVEPVKTYTDKKVPGWNLRPGLPVGCKITLRDEKAVEVLEKLLEAVDNELSERQFDSQGNFSFGVDEYISIPGVEYDQDIKMMGLEVAVTLERPGYRVKDRKTKDKKLSDEHKISPEEAMDFMTEEFGISIEEES